MRRRDKTCCVGHCPNCKNKDVCLILVCECGFVGCRFGDDSRGGCFGRRCPWCYKPSAFIQIGVVATLEAALHIKGLGFIAKAALCAFSALMENSVPIEKDVEDATLAFDSYWRSVKAAHDEKEAERLAEIEREKTCECDACVTKRQEAAELEAEREANTSDNDYDDIPDDYDD